MRERDLPFFRLAMAYSVQWADYFRSRQLTPQLQAAFEQESRRSVQARKEIENADNISFEQYLGNYYSQYQAL